MTSSGRFDLVVFDLDGVLVDTSPCHRAAFEALWREIGITGPPYESLAGRTTLQVVRDCTRALAPTEGQLREWVLFKQERARAEIETRSLIFDDTVRCVGELSRRGYRLAIATGASRESAEAVLRRYDLRNLFQAVVTGNDVKDGKPSPEVYARAISDMGASPQGTLVVEDSVAGVQAALGAGAYTMVVRTNVAFRHKRFLGVFPNLDSILVTRYVTPSL